MLRLSVLDQSTVVTGRSPDTSIRESLALAQALRGPWLRALLVRRAPRLRQPGRHRAGDPDQRHRRHHHAHPRRQRRGHAAPLLQPEGRRAVPRAGGDRPRADRSRPRPRPRLRRPHRIRAQPVRRDRGGPFPGAGARPVRLARRRDAGRRAIRSATSSPSRSGPTMPEVWMLGSSDYGPQVAAYFGMPFCFAHFITDGRGVEQAMALYRAELPPERALPKALWRAVCLGNGGGDRGGSGAVVQLA